MWWEPQQFAGGQPLETFFEDVPGEDNLGLSWHNYCPEVFFESQGVPGSDVEKCKEFSNERNEHALDQGRRMRATTLMSEFGATDNVRALEIDTDAADAHLMGSVHWAYKGWRDPTTADDAQGLFRDDRDRGTVKRAKLPPWCAPTPRPPRGARSARASPARPGSSATATPRQGASPCPRWSSSARCTTPTATASRCATGGWWAATGGWSRSRGAGDTVQVVVRRR